jgi:hypothetical protein
MTEHFGTGTKKGRGMAQESIDLIEAMYDKAKAAQPITGRGIGYKLFTAGLIPSMERPEMRRVYRLLKEAREQGIIPWEWIVDETRELERVSTWADPASYARCVAQSYRRDFWDQQPVHILVVSEKGTVRGLLKPVLNHFAVGFQVMHGFSSATTVYDISQDDDGRPLIILYVGDFDPSGIFMSEVDLPNRFSKYDGDHITLKRIALMREHVNGLPSFPATDKRKDPRLARCMKFDDRDKAALHALDDTFTVNNNGEVASIAGEMEVTIIRPADDGGARFWLTIKFPSGEELDVRIARAQLLDQLDVEPDES